MVFVEFLECIGRVASLKYKDEEDLPLDKKIELILDDILKLVNYERRDPTVLEFYESESD